MTMILTHSPPPDAAQLMMDDHWYGCHDYDQLDRLAEDILTDRHEIVDLDAKRNKCREATRRIQEQFTDVSKLVLRYQKTIDKEINTLRDGLKPKVARLHEMEGRPEVKGFSVDSFNTG
ncbi:LOW QUALITY PROTEIN: p53 and DNA damage-regulated protein 1-like [Gigantopelta aegis]|uniref:LOW QUALITY PROTEIN: p53 and DNA damage-regulated protein 1-like n=1 Tax=Gigantopelta aegis TaxID=1735272 RepID=UPI001B8892EE|nr:LOW QUALITY PROTEIN: p53 and DNA damage-regulated protein 1-like [Gigantopelta aegis]